MASEDHDVGYFAQTVSEKLNITRSKLRRLSLALERYGYVFTRNALKQRIYFDSDIQMMRRLQKKIDSGLVVNEAAETLCKEIKSETKQENESMPLSNPAPSNEGVKISITAEQLRLVVEQVAATVAEKTADRVVSKLNKGIERRIEQRDKELLLRLRETTASARKERKGWLSRLFGVR